MVSAEKQLEQFVGTIEGLKNLLAELPGFIRALEKEYANHLEAEPFQLLLDLEKTFVDNKWFDNTWDIYFSLKSKHHLDELVLLIFSKKQNFRFTVPHVKYGKRIRKCLAMYGKKPYPFFNVMRNFLHEFQDLFYGLKNIIMHENTNLEKSAQKIFWKKNRPKKTTYQANLDIAKHRKINLRLVFSPKSKTIDLSGLAGECSEETWARIFSEHYVENNEYPKKILENLFNELCNNVKEVMKEKTITRYYGPSFSIALQVEMRNSFSGGGLFSILRKNKHNKVITYVPNHHHLIISIPPSIIFKSSDLQSTLYHEIIHNLTIHKINLADDSTIIHLSLMRHELITTILTAIREGSDKDCKKDQVLTWKNIHSNKLDSLPEFTQALCLTGSVHSIAFLMGLQILVCSLKLGTGKETPEEMFNLVMKQKDRAIRHINSISSLSPEKLFIYYKRKIPKSASYFEAEFLDSLIAIFKKK